MACTPLRALRGSRHPHLQMLPSSPDDRLNLDIPVLDGAACVREDPELFYSDHPSQIARAKAVCGRCPVRAACLARALADDEAFGVFGGLTTRERRALRRQTARKGAAA